MQGSESPNAFPPYTPLLETAYGALRAQILCVAAELGLAEHLAQSGPVTASELAPKLSVDAAILERVLRGLVSMNVCDEIEGSRFRLTALGEYLRPNHPDSVEARVLLHGQVFYRMWGELAETIRTGKGGSQARLGNAVLSVLHQGAAGWLAVRSDNGQRRAIPSSARRRSLRFWAIRRCGRCWRRQRRADGRNPKGVSPADRHRLRSAASRTSRTADYRRRRAGRSLSFCRGRCFGDRYRGYDAYVLSNFLVSWGDDHAVILLRNCRKAIAENGKVLLIEWVMPAGNEPRERFRFFDTVSRDLIMLSINGSGRGRVRTRSGFHDLLDAAGFEMTAVIPTRGSVSVIEARPV